MAPVVVARETFSLDWLAGLLFTVTFLAMLSISIRPALGEPGGFLSKAIDVVLAVVAASLFAALFILAGMWVYSVLMRWFGAVSALLAWPPIYFFTLFYPKIHFAVGAVNLMPMRLAKRLGRRKQA